MGKNILSAEIEIVRVDRGAPYSDVRWKPWRSESLPRPLVIIDGRSVSSVLFGKSPGILFDYAEVHRSLSALHTQLESLDVDVVVYFAGTAADREYYMQHQVSTVEGIVHCIRKWHDYETLDKINVNSLRSYRDVVRFVFALYFKVICSVSDCESEMVHYARKQQCLAIIGNDTDFLIYNAGKYYWPFLNINFANKTVEMYNMKKFTQQLNTNFEHLPLLVSVLGNHVISQEKLGDFFGSTPGGAKKLLIASRVLTRYRNMTLQELRKSPCFEKVLNEIFPGAKDKKTLYQDFAKNIAMYTDNVYIDKSEVLEEVHEYAKDLVSRNEIPAAFFHLLKSKNFYENFGIQESTNGLNYFRENKVYEDLRKRLYYMLFRDESCDIKEYCFKYNLDELSVQVEVKVTKPTKFDLAVNMDLLELWKNKEKNVEELKWKLFIDSLSVNKAIDIDEFRALPAKYYFPVGILNYLLNHPTIEVLEEWEADVFLCHLSLKGKVPEAKECNLRAVELINIYNNGLLYICYLVAASGFPISIETLMQCNGKEWHFNGKAFYNLYCHAARGRRDLITDDLSTQPRRLLGLI